MGASFTKNSQSSSTKVPDCLNKEKSGTQLGEIITPASKYFFSNLKNMNLPE
jgi:hypothetical protein